MSMLSDQAICIGNRNYSESSQIVTLFGRSSGKIRAIGKGSRRAKGKFSGGIDLLTAGQVQFIPPRSDSSLATLVEFDLTESFSPLRQRLVALHCGEYGAYLVGAFTEDLDPHELLYEQLFHLLGRLSDPTVGCAGTLVRFELELLGEVGLIPVWHKCCICRGALPSLPRLYFSSSSGGMLCRECEPSVIEKRFVNAAALQILQSPTAAETAKPAAILEAHELLSYHHRELLGKEHAIMTFLNQLLRRQAASNQQ